MSVLRQLNLLSQMRLDVPHLRALESSITADFDVLAGRVITGSKPVVVRGFNLANFAAGTPATSIQLVVADSILMNIGASESGTFFWAPSNRTPEVLDAALNPKVSGGFTAGQVNYIGLDLLRSADATTADLVQFLDANTLIEAPKTVPLARTLDYRIVISTVPFSAQTNLVPIAKIRTTTSNQVASAATDVSDSRNLLFRLGTGGDFPDRGHAFGWSQGRNDFNIVTGSTINQFQGGDKVFRSQKDWMDSVMSRLWELGGGESWFSPTADRNVRMLRATSPAVFVSNGDNFEFVSSNLHWQGLRIAFENSNAAGVYFNQIADQLSDFPGLTDIVPGECIYVDLDRTQNATLVAKKSALRTLGVPSVPGSRIVIAWCGDTGTVLTRDSAFPVNTSVGPATPTAIGGVKLSRAASTPGTPIVIADTGGTITALVTNQVALTINANTGGGNPTGSLVVTGTGTGNGIFSTGGASNGSGVRGQGGGVGGVGVFGQGGTTNGAGAAFFGGGNSGQGVQGTGGGTGGLGVRGTGGTASGIGGIFTGGLTGDGVHGDGGATSGNGGVFTGGGTGAGVIGYSGLTGTYGISGFGNNSAGVSHGVRGEGGSGLGGNGVQGFGTVSYSGGYFEGGPTDGSGGVFLGKASGYGVYSTPGATGIGGYFIGGTTSGVALQAVGNQTHAIRATTTYSGTTAAYLGNTSYNFAAIGNAPGVIAGTMTSGPAALFLAVDSSGGTASEHRGAYPILAQGYDTNGYSEFRGWGGSGGTASSIALRVLGGIATSGNTAGGDALRVFGGFATGTGAPGKGLVVTAGTGGTGNANAIEATASGSGNALSAIATTGLGINASSTTGNAVQGVASATGIGVYGISDSGPGVKALSTGSGYALEVGTGNAHFGASNPSSSTGFSNTMTPANVPKSWGQILANAGTITLTGGFNTTSAVVNNTNFIRVTFATPMANTNYAVMITVMQKTSQNVSILILNSCNLNTNYFDIAAYDTAANAQVVLTGSAFTLSYVVFATQ